MAASRLFFSSSTLPISLSSLSTSQTQNRTNLTFTHAFSELAPATGKRRRQLAHASGGDLLGDFGARDPFAAEIESNFAEKVLGNVDTEHKILIPNASSLSLAQQECTPVSPYQPPISEDDAQTFLRKVVFEYSFDFFLKPFLKLYILVAKFWFSTNKLLEEPNFYYPFLFFYFINKWSIGLMLSYESAISLYCS
uniref:Uncharacterized protein n=1 Tax=Nelumbo nucifera TaxID=4432 RepID=A0A822XF35_NELNU|nr:TPA_asm: hypothetical protein HUJ06_019726 [Nelumbo nucifera]